MISPQINFSAAAICGTPTILSLQTIEDAAEALELIIFGKDFGITPKPGQRSSESFARSFSRSVASRARSGHALTTKQVDTVKSLIERYRTQLTQQFAEHEIATVLRDAPLRIPSVESIEVPREVRYLGGIWLLFRMPWRSKPHLILEEMTFQGGFADQKAAVYLEEPGVWRVMTHRGNAGHVWQFMQDHSFTTDDDVLGYLDILLHEKPEPNFAGIVDGRIAISCRDDSKLSCRILSARGGDVDGGLIWLDATAINARYISRIAAVCQIFVDEEIEAFAMTCSENPIERVRDRDFNALVMSDQSLEDFATRLRGITERDIIILTECSDNQSRADMNILFSDFEDDSFPAEDVISQYRDAILIIPHDAEIDSRVRAYVRRECPQIIDFLPGPNSKEWGVTSIRKMTVTAKSSTVWPTVMEKLLIRDTQHCGIVLHDIEEI